MAEAETIRTVARDAAILWWICMGSLLLDERLTGISDPSRLTGGIVSYLKTYDGDLKNRDRIPVFPVKN
jgi:hypothetical protein